MDPPSVAQLRNGARFQPVKDMHSSFSRMLASKDAEKFQQLKQDTLTSIDTAKSELELLRIEIENMGSVSNHSESENFAQSTKSVLDEAEILKKEFNEYAEKRKRFIELQHAINELKGSPKPQDYNDKIAKLRAQIEKDKKEAETAEAENTRKAKGLGMLSEGVRMFSDDHNTN